MIGVIVIVVVDIFFTLKKLYCNKLIQHHNWIELNRNDNSEKNFFFYIIINRNQIESKWNDENNLFDWNKYIERMNELRVFFLFLWCYHFHIKIQQRKKKKYIIPIQFWFVFNYCIFFLHYIAKFHCRGMSNLNAMVEFKSWKKIQNNLTLHGSLMNF